MVGLEMPMNARASNRIDATVALAMMDVESQLLRDYLKRIDALIERARKLREETEPVSAQ